MYYTVTGKRDKFFFSGIDDLQYGLTQNINLKSKGYNCIDYDSSDFTIDGVIVINNKPIDNVSLLKLRFFEMFNPNKFKKELGVIADYKYFRIALNESDKIYDEYLKGNLTSQLLRQMLEI